MVYNDRWTNLKKNWRFIIIIILYSSTFLIQMYCSNLQILIQCYNHPPTKQVSILLLQKFKVGYWKVKSCKELRGLLVCNIRLMLGTLFFFFPHHTLSFIWNLISFPRLKIQGWETQNVQWSYVRDCLQKHKKHWEAKVFNWHPIK